LRKNPSLKLLLPFILIFYVFQAAFISCVTNSSVQAEEYFTIGMAYFELGKFADAEIWLNRAKLADKTMVASDYNLGRIAFETGRYKDAAKFFESVLQLDPDNVMALKAAAYTRIKNGDLEKAEAFYDRVLELVPESADDGFNYALVLYGLEKFEDCEDILNKYPFALEEKPSSILLLARTQKAQDKVEAIDSYEKWIIVNTGTPNPQGLYEYAQVLEGAGFYAKAIEQYQEAIKALTRDTEELKKSKLRFEEARLLLTMDSENEEGITELNKAVDEGFYDADAFEIMLEDERITEQAKDEIRRIIKEHESKNLPEDTEEETEETEETEGDTES
jgi:tetratricopeptide (TPR) repeat protein